MNDIELLKIGFTPKEILNIRTQEIFGKDLKITSLEKENEQLKKQLDQVYRECVIIDE